MKTPQLLYTKCFQHYFSSFHFYECLSHAQLEFFFFENPTGLFIESALLVLRLVPGFSNEKICFARGVLSSNDELFDEFSGDDDSEELLGDDE